MSNKVLTADEEIIAPILGAIYHPAEDKPKPPESKPVLCYRPVVAWQRETGAAKSRANQWLHAEPIRCKGLILSLRWLWRHRADVATLGGIALYLQIIYWLATWLVG